MAKREARLVPWGALNQAIADHLATLSVDSFLDVTLTSEATGEVLYYNGTAWVNTDAVSVDPSTAVVLSYNGSTAGGTQANGLFNQPASGNSTFELKNSAGTRRSLLTVTDGGTEFIMRNDTNSGLVTIDSRDSGGTLKDILSGNPNNTLNL